MKDAACGFCSSVCKKYQMALSGGVLAGFVLVHMLGNLQFFLGPAAINSYAYKLAHGLPGGVASLWAFRLILATAVLVHIATGIALARENRLAAGKTEGPKRYKKAGIAARTMAFSGLLLVAFIVFHILQFTVRAIPEPYEQTLQTTSIAGIDEPVFDVYAMMVAGFSEAWVVLFYLAAVATLGFHLSHGAASLFQSLGLSNTLWRKRLEHLAKLYGLGIFLGFASVPVAVFGFGMGQDYLKTQRQNAAKTISHKAAICQNAEANAKINLQQKREGKNQFQAPQNGLNGLLFYNKKQKNSQNRHFWHASCSAF